MVFTQILYLYNQGLQDQNKGITNCAEFTVQWRNYPIWRYPVKASGGLKTANYQPTVLLWQSK